MSGLSAAETVFVGQLQEGATLGRAASMTPGLDIARPLAQLIRTGAISHFTFASGEHPA
ncbi:hypothetical protein ACE0DR_12355 [Azotobacter sp. CWF10]